MHRIVTLAVLLFVTSLASAQTTHFVDTAGGAGIHTDIQSAINAAGHGDTIDVAPGTYPSFTCSKGVTIIGSGAPRVDPNSILQNLPGGRQIVLADLQTSSVQVLNCDGVVVMNNVVFDNLGANSNPTDQHVTVDDCSDVRMHGCTVDGLNFSFSSSRAGIKAENSRLEIAQCYIEGDVGASSDCGNGGYGSAALWTTGTSRTHVANSSFKGGNGGGQEATCSSFCGGLAGNGGAGIAHFGGDLIVAGILAGSIQGGDGGCGAAISCDGDGGPGIAQFAGHADINPALPLGGEGTCNSSDGQPHVISGGTFTNPNPDWATLEVTGSQTGGGNLVFTANGPPNANLRLWLGRFAVVQPSAGIPIERLCQWLRGAAPGNLPASGQLSVNQPLPHWLPRGFTFYAQAELVTNTGQVLRTNSLSIVMR